MLFKKKLRNIDLAKLLLTLGVAFVIVQFLLLNYKYKDKKYDISKENILLFTSVLHGSSVPVILIDPHILSRVLSNASQLPARCRFLCHTPGVTTFAVLSNIWRNEKVVTERLRTKEFKVVRFSARDPRHQLSVNVSAVVPDLPTHYLFTRHSHLIHLVVFYERGSSGDTYWWHGALPLSESSASNILDVSQFYFGRHAGAYTEIVTQKVTLDGVRVRAPRFPSSLLEQTKHSHFIECDHARARRFHDLHGIKSSPNFLSDAAVLMKRAKHVLDSLKVPFWLSSGTCLGWFRQCSIIAHSKDVDFGIWIKDYDPRMISVMEENGIFIKHIFGKVSDSFELSFDDGAVKLDIFFFYEDDTHMWNGGTQSRTGNKYKYLFPKFNLCWTEFEHLKFRVPCDTQAYIEANYGLNWFEPVHSWDWKRSPPNVRPNGKWSDNERSNVIQTFL